MSNGDDIPTIYRTVFEERAPLQQSILDTDKATVRFGLRSFDYSIEGECTLTCWEGGTDTRPLIFKLDNTKNSITYVERELPKAIDEYDRVL